MRKVLSVLIFGFLASTKVHALTPTLTPTQAPTPVTDELVYDGDNASQWVPNSNSSMTTQNVGNHTSAGTYCGDFQNNFLLPAIVHLDGPSHNASDFDYLEFWVYPTTADLELTLTFTDKTGTGQFSTGYWLPAFNGAWQLGQWNHVILPFSTLALSAPFDNISIEGTTEIASSFAIDDVWLRKGSVPGWVTTPTPVPTSAPGSGCGNALNAVVLAGNPRVELYGNLDACTPANPLAYYGSSGSPSGFVPDRSVDFSFLDPDGNTRDFRVSFASTTSDPYNPQWYLCLNEITGGAVPNSEYWVEGGPGNILGEWLLQFDAQGRLVDTGNGGAAYDVPMPLTNFPAFHFSLSVGKDFNALPAASGYRIGLTSDACCVLPTATPTDTPYVTATPTATPTRFIPDQLIYDGDNASAWSLDLASDNLTPTTSQNHTVAGTTSGQFSSDYYGSTLAQLTGPLSQFRDYDYLELWVRPAAPELSLKISLQGPDGNFWVRYEPSTHGPWVLGQWNRVILPLGDPSLPADFEHFYLDGNTYGASGFEIDDVWLRRGPIPAGVVTPTPVPTAVVGAACGQPLWFTNHTGPWAVDLFGNLDANTPANPLSAYGPPGSPNGFVPDRSVDFTVTDPFGSVHVIRASFAKSSDDPYQPNWRAIYNDVTGGVLPNASNWVPGGPGNQIGQYDMIFDDGGKLIDNGNGGAGHRCEMFMSGLPGNVFIFEVNVGEDVSAASAAGFATHYRDGLTSDPCGPRATITATVTSTISPTFSPPPTQSLTKTPSLTATITRTMSTTPSATETVMATFAVTFTTTPTLIAATSGIFTCPVYGLTGPGINGPRSGVTQYLSVTLTASGDLQALGFYAGGFSSGSQRGIRMALYQSTYPWLLLGETAVQTAVFGWNRLALPLYGLSPGNYWVAVQTEADVMSGLVTGGGTARTAATSWGPFGVNNMAGPSTVYAPIVVMEVCAGPAGTGTPTATPTFTITAGSTTASPSKTISPTPTVTATSTGCACTTTYTRTVTPTSTVTRTSSPSLTPSLSPTSTASPTFTDTGSPTRVFSATATPTACGLCGTPTETMTMTPQVTDTVVVPLYVPTVVSSSSSSVSVVPSNNPAAPSPSNPLALFYPLAVGASVPNAKLLVFSTAGSLIASLPCQVCNGPSLTFSWDGSGVASGLYYVAVELGDGVVRGQFPLMVLP